MPPARQYRLKYAGYLTFILPKPIFVELYPTVSHVSINSRKHTFRVRSSNTPDSG